MGNVRTASPTSREASRAKSFYVPMGSATVVTGTSRRTAVALSRRCVKATSGSVVAPWLPTIPDKSFSIVAPDTL